MVKSPPSVRSETRECVEAQEDREGPHGLRRRVRTATRALSLRGKALKYGGGLWPGGKPPNRGSGGRCRGTWFIGGNQTGPGGQGDYSTPAGRNECTRWWPNNHSGAWPIPECIGVRPPITHCAGKPPITPPIGGGDCTLSCKLPFRAGKNVPSLCVLTMGGSYGCDRGSDRLGPNRLASIGSSRLLEPKVGVKGG